MFDAGKTRMTGLPYGEKNCDDMLSRFHLVPERNGQTDGQICYINIARQCDINIALTLILTRDKNLTKCINALRITGESVRRWRRGLM